MYSIYNMVNPLDNSIFYVGNTVDPKRRYYQHWRDRNHPEKYSLIKQIRESGQKPVMNALKSDIKEKELADFIESEYIDLYKFQGIELLNRNLGGNNPPSQLRKKASEDFKTEHSKNSPLKKTICQYDLNGNLLKTYHSARFASKETKINSATIIEVANGNRKTAGGYKWKYEGGQNG